MHGWRLCEGKEGGASEKGGKEGGVSEEGGKEGGVSEEGGKEGGVSEEGGKEGVVGYTLILTSHSCVVFPNVHVHVHACVHK